MHTCLNLQRPPTGYHRVLCALDLTSTSLPLLQWASEFAREQGATLKLVHAIPAAAPAGLELEGGRFRAALFNMATEELAKLQEQAGTSLEIALAAGDVAAVVRQTAEENRADLVIIGRGVMQAALGRLRTNVMRSFGKPLALYSVSNYPPDSLFLPDCLRGPAAPAHQLLCTRQLLTVVCATIPPGKRT